MEKLRIKIIGKLKKELEDNFVEALDCHELKSNQIIFFCDYSEFDIPVGYCFTEVVRSDNTILNCKVLLVNISQQFFKPFDEIPHGWKTISKFEFVDGVIPDEVQRL
ncbi:hypothetical protein [Chitinophaga sp. W3I9]|uniref:hypothetical protein n=1 Tax=Chitinophaga sp. W3I9 TaxID=3373924 RepID=UPI003D25D7FA